MSSKNETAIMILPGKKREPQQDNQVDNDVHSSQSSITNSWVPRLKLYHPAPYAPHKPIENMVISIQKPGSECSSREEAGKGGDDNTNSTARSSSHSGPPGSFRRNGTELLHGVMEADEQDTQDQLSLPAAMLSLALTEEQKADVEQYVFRGWGSDDDVDFVAQSNQSVPPQNQAETKNSKQTPGRFVMEEEALPHSNPQVIQDAIEELQALTGMQVKCLDADDGAKNDHTHGDTRTQDLSSSSDVDGKTVIVSRGDVEKTRKEKQDDNQKSGWFFGAPARKDVPLDNDGDLSQPYALIRNDEDEARFRKRCKEEERLRQEEGMRLDEEKKKKKASWFFFSKEVERVEVLDGDKMADALDDLEILAGEVRVSQVKEARLMERDGKEHGNHNNGVLGTGYIDGPQKSFRSTSLSFSQTRGEGQGLTSDSTHGVLSPAEAPITSDLASRGRVVSDWQMKSLSRFALPLETSDSDAPLGWKDKRERHTRSLATPGVLSTNYMFANSFSSIGKPHTSEVDIDLNQNPPEESECRDPGSQDVEIDESLPLPTKASQLKKDALIADLSKRDLRWRLNQASVDSVFKEYHSAMADIDHLLPSHDEFDNMKHLGRSIDVQFYEVRNKMLEDGNLSEREVASFFGGFSLLAMKARSLQCQLDAFKAISRATTEERKLRSLSPANLMSEDIIREAPRILLIRSMMADSDVAPETKSLLRQLEVNERKRIKLEKELFESGNALPEHLPFEEAKGAVERISKKIEEVKSKNASRSTETMVKEHNSEIKLLENELRKYQPSLVMGDMWAKAEEKWEADNAAENLDALRRIRRHMPVNVEVLNEDQLAIETTPNGKLLPRRIAKKFKQTTILQLLRAHPDDVFRMHPTTLENLQSVGLTLSERRAIYLHLKGVAMRWRAAADEPAASRKWAWFRMLKQEFKEALCAFERHCQEYGAPDSHIYATRAEPTKGCPLIGKQCPVKADKMFDYGVDYGFPDGDVFVDKHCTSDRRQESGMAASDDAIREKAFRRREPIEKHYKGRVLQVALACDSCEAMDKIMDRMESQQEEWIEDRLRREKERFTDMHRRIEIGSFAAAVHDLKLALPPLAERSGMQLTGSRESNAARPDNRSPIELGLCEEVWEHAEHFFTGIESRLRELDANDTEVKAEVTQLRELFDELHNRNMCTINELGVRYPSASRKLIKRKEIEMRVRDKLAHEFVEVVTESEMSSPYKMTRKSKTAGAPIDTSQPEHKLVAVPSVEKREGERVENELKRAIPADGTADHAPSTQGPSELTATIDHEGLEVSTSDHSSDDVDSNAILSDSKSRKPPGLIDANDENCECNGEMATDLPMCSHNSEENGGNANSSHDVSPSYQDTVLVATDVHNSEENGGNANSSHDVSPSYQDTVLVATDVHNSEENGGIANSSHDAVTSHQDTVFVPTDVGSRSNDSESLKGSAIPSTGHGGSSGGRFRENRKAFILSTDQGSTVAGARMSTSGTRSLKQRELSEIGPSSPPLATTAGVKESSGTELTRMSDQALTDRSNTSWTSGFDGVTFNQVELRDANPWARSSAVEMQPSLTHSTTDDQSAAKPTTGVLARARVRSRWNETPMDLSSSEVTNNPIKSADGLPSHGRARVEGLRQRRLQTRSSCSLPSFITSRESSVITSNEPGADVGSAEKASNMITDCTSFPVSTNNPNRGDNDSVMETFDVGLPYDSSAAPIAEGDSAPTVERTASDNENSPYAMLSDPSGHGQMKAGANESADPTSIGSSSQISLPSCEGIADEPVKSEATDLLSEGVASRTIDIEEVRDRNSRPIREKMSVTGKVSGDSIHSYSGNGRWRQRIASRSNDVEERADSPPVDSIRRRSMPWRERIAARTSDVEEANVSPLDTTRRESLSWRTRIAARTSDLEQSAAPTHVHSIRRSSLPMRERIAATANDAEELVDSAPLDFPRRRNFSLRTRMAARTIDAVELAVPPRLGISVEENESTDPILPFLSLRNDDDVHEKIAEVQSDDDDVLPVVSTDNNGLPSRDTIASGISDAKVMAQPTPADCNSRKGVVLREGIAEVKRGADEWPDPFPSDSARERSYSSIERVTTGGNSALGSLDSTTVDSSYRRVDSQRETSASGEIFDKESTDPVPANSTRRKSLVLRERIAVVRSPGRERDVSSLSERRASIEARRAQVQAGIAERKKARDEAARLSESK
jgi:hypothetical protein